MEYVVLITAIISGIESLAGSYRQVMETVTKAQTENRDITKEEVATLVAALGEAEANRRKALADMLVRTQVGRVGT